MTWLGDTTIAEKRDYDTLLVKRAMLVLEIEELKAKPLPNKTVSAATFRQEDLINLAKKIKVIDKKLGRIHT